MKKPLVGKKILILQEDFLKENELIQVRMVIDKRSLKFDPNYGEYEFAS